MGEVKNFPKKIHIGEIFGRNICYIHKRVLSLWCQIKTTSKMITKQELKIQLANELFAIKMQLRKIGFILQCNEPTPEVKKQLDRLLDRKRTIERVLEELEK